MYRKSILVGIGCLIIGALASPIIGMGIAKTRSIILSFAPKDSILELADKIDSNGKETDIKISELQATVDLQKSQIEEQQKMIDSQKIEVEKTINDTTATQSTVNNEQNCRKAQELYATVPDNKNGSCRTLGPTNIVQAYEKAKESYKNAKAGNFSDKKAATNCSKKYLDIVEPLYNEYLKAKELCK